MLKIYGIPISVHTRKVILAARLKDLRYEVIPVVPVIPDSPPPNWRALSPTGLIPVLQDGAFTLADSAAICAYLDRKHPHPALYPLDAPRYGYALWLEQYAGGTVFCDVVRPLFHELFVQPKVKGIATDRMRVDEILTRVLPEALGYLNAASRDGDRASEIPSVADLAVMSNLTTLGYIGVVLDRSRLPKLAAWYDRIVRVPEVTAVLRDEQSTVRQLGLNSDFLTDLLA
jgi:glutathione S-transferase